MNRDQDAQSSSAASFLVARTLGYGSAQHGIVVVGARQAVGDSGAAVSPARWLSCGDLDTADAELGYHDDGGHLLTVSEGQDVMTSSDPELYSCSSMSVIHTTQPTSIGPPPLLNGISLHGVVTSEM